MSISSHNTYGKLRRQLGSMVKKPENVIGRPESIHPFLDLVRLLRPRATLWGTIHARGRWGVSFRERQDLLFFRVDAGKSLLLRPAMEPLQLAERDLVLIRTTAPFAVASDPFVECAVSEHQVAARKSTEMHVGEGEGDLTLVRGGRFAFDTANEDVLMDLLPALVYVPAGEGTSEHARALLALNEAETLHPREGSEFVVPRLMELLLVELLRGGALKTQPIHAGLLKGLGDPVIAQALAMMHGNVAFRWTAGKIARECGCSRSAFNLRFTTIVGIAPMRYLHSWRVAVAKDELRQGRRSVAEIALLVGFESSGAFSTAFTRVVGCSPSNFASKLS